ncbi:MAG: glutathione synthase [Sphingomonadaceae bacterium]|nr:glutathione synthase [Sphingomonadaceae bacterium]
MRPPLAIAVQMDPIETINVAGDSTFALMLEAQARGHRLAHFLPQALDWIDGRVMATARDLEVVRPSAPGAPHFRWLDGPRTRDIARDFNVVLMRQDPPFDMAYVTATHLLERAQALGVVVVNDPAAVRNAPEKLFVLEFADLMPPTLVTRSLEAIRAFRARHGDLVLKPLYGNAGTAVFHLDAADPNLAALVELFGRVWREPFMVQAFLPEVAQGDKRIILIDGEPAGAINRLPQGGEIRSNLAAGGRAEPADLSDRDRTICARLGPELRRRGLLFVGIDVIGGYLTEINVTSPTGLVTMDAFNGTNTAARFWKAVETRVAARA